MMSPITRFLGDTPARVVLKLIVVSFLVGVVMAALNWTPWDVLYNIRDFIISLWELAFEAFARFGTYLITGAVIVIPAFIILRILNMRSS